MISKIRAAIIVLLVAVALPTFGLTKLQGYVEQGGQRVTVAGFSSSTFAQRSYPYATVSVYATGTATLSTIYSTNTGTAKANPFTAGSDASWSFFIADGTYDITFSAGSSPYNFPTTPYTWSALEVSPDGALTVPVTGMGAVCDGTTDDTVAIQAAVSVTGGHIVSFPAGTCKTTDQITATQGSITFQGAGKNATYILYMPTVSNEAAIKFDDGLGTSAVINYPSVRDLTIYTTDTTYQKTGIWIEDATGAFVENVQIGTDGNWRGGTDVSPFTGSGSIGIKLQGREFGRFINVASAGAIPLYIDNNPDFAAIDLDHHSFSGMYLIPYGNNPNVYVATGSQLTNIAFRDSAFVKGGYGVYWADTTSTASSFDVSFKNIRGEQFSSAGHMFYISYNPGSASLYNLRIEDVTCGATTTIKGAYLRGIGTAVTFDGFTYNGTIECLNADSTVAAIDWRNSDCQTASTASLGTLVNLEGKDYTDSSAPIPLNGYWITPGSVVTAKKTFTEFGVYNWGGTGSLADAANVDITPGGGALVTGTVFITFKGATLNGALVCAINGAQSYTLATSDATLAACDGNVAGDFTMDWVNINNILIRNNVGETVTYNYQMFWN